MIYLIAGLGNPGTKYENTRHNVGFQAIYDISVKYKLKDKERQEFDGRLAPLILDDKKILVCEPMTFMNLSGECIEQVARFYKIPTENIIIIYDDVDLPVGEVRVKPRGGAGGQNGMKSIIYCLDSDDFPRIRIGTGPRVPDMDLVRYVLSPFPPEQVPIIEKAAERAAEAAILIVTEGLERAMTKINSMENIKPE